MLQNKCFLPLRATGRDALISSKTASRPLVRWHGSQFLAFPKRNLHSSPVHAASRPSPVYLKKSSKDQRAESKKESEGSAAPKNNPFGWGATAIFAVATTLMAESLLRNPPDRSSTQSLEKSATAKYSVSPDTLRKAIGQLKKDIAADRIIRDVGECTNKSSTAWSPAPEETDCPSFIVYPISTLEVSKIAKVCHELGIPMLPYSGGTSLEGSLAMTTKGGCCIDFKLMDRVIGVNKKDMDVVVQPGVDYMELNQTLAEQNLFFPPDPGPGAKIGGMIAQGCSGTNAYRYGPMKEWVLGLTVVLADGTIIKTRHRPRKSSAGYDLTQLIVGSEGTLGIVTEASLKLTSKPQNVRVAVVAFPSIPNAVDSAIKVVQEDLPVAALELLDDFTMKAVNEAGYCEKQYAETATLFLKFSGYSDRMVQEIIGKVMDIAKANNCSSFEISKTEREASDLWQARKTALWSVLALRRKPEDKFLSSDAAVPISRLGDLIEATQADIKESGVLGSCIGHVGDGNFHAGILYDPQDEKIARTIIQNVQRRAVKMKGTVSGEHGIGLENRDALTEELGQQSIDTMRKVKAALDPKNLLNPDKIFHQKWVAKDSWIPFSSSASSKGYQDQDIVQDIKSTLGWS